MSFILDALKKSETDRQRQSGPALFEVKIAPPKARFPLWAVAIAVLLGVNLVIGGWLLLRRTSHAEEVGATATASSMGTAAPPATTPSTAPSSAVSLSVPTSTRTQAASTGPTSPVAATTPLSGSAPAGLSNRQTGQAGASPGTQPDANAGTGREPTLAGAAAQNAPAPASEPAAAGVNPDDYAPATDPGQMPGLTGHVRRGTASGFMLYQDAALVPGSNLPQLRLDLHVYAAKPQDRFALINMHKLREGDSLPEGVRVDSITPEGVVMEHNGLKFLLPRD